MSATLRGLPPQIAPGCRALVLGSMPGDASLSAGQYYAHPRNRFWQLMGRLCGVDAGQSYESRLHALHAAGIGLWDVIGECQRSGSLDAAIVRGTEIPNPIAERLSDWPELRVIAFNGGKAAEAFRRHLQPRLGLVLDRRRIALLPLPSTSPANAAFGLERLAEAWTPLRDCF
ncbi:DNA-deoxyinosine glycosylase [Pseudoxanthomonas sp. UTMC 1351]|uniref:DNA-deoxyinosine glycosylase n=1 Tax=Pseudoxanthomonas sp. UTMC 1351 TaxID=2695853 RepID=UPI0034CD4F41